jgi:serine phosphatase RsbU (regulator of sigma subunit)
VSANVLSDFQFEFDQEQNRRLRKRVLWYAGVSAVLGLLMLIVGVFAKVDLDGAQGSARMALVLKALMLAANLAATIPAVWAYARVYYNKLDRPRMLATVYWLIVISSVLSTVFNFIVTFIGTQPNPAGFAGMQFLAIFFAHVLACLFLPWTPAESLRPMYPVIAISVGCIAAALLVLPGLNAATIAVSIFLALTCIAAVLPGLGIAWWKHNSFARDFLVRSLSGRYGEFRRELSGAQRIHEALFPRPATSPHLRFDYRYTPMRSIGGDYLYAKFLRSAHAHHDQGESPDDLLVLLLDVTGHGIPAALTVNRLYGEVERLVAEDQRITPTALLRALNRYAFLTLSDHSLFVTAIALRVQPGEARVQYCNAGHPPAFVLPADGVGTPIELAPTAMVLGVARDLDVEQEDARVPLHPGDTLVAYTDGAMESRNAQGRMLNVEGVRELICKAPRASTDGARTLCAQLMSAIDAHRFGPPADDTLIVEVQRLRAGARGELAPTATTHDAARATVHSA